ncbi:MAG: hypothetical protein ACWA5L_05095 [bacterium]
MTRSIARNILPILAVLLLLLPGAPLWAKDDGSLADARLRQQEEASLREQIAFTNEVCGTSIRASINWRSVSNWPDNGKGIARVCDGALGAVESLCRSDKKSQIQSKIKSFQCLGDGSGPALSGSSLKYGGRPGGNGFSQTKAYLDRKL